MTELCVVVDQLLAPAPGGVGRYAEELTRALIASAPEGAAVTGFVSRHPEEELDRVRRMLPGLADLRVDRLDRRALSLAWELGAVAWPAPGMIHAMSQLAPLRPHDRASGRQVVVTIHDTAPWTGPETLTRRGAAWHRRMADRAVRYADAVVAPSHVVAEELRELLGLGERVRVIPGAVTRSLLPGEDEDDRATRLDLPSRYVLAVGAVEPRKGLPALVRAMARPELADAVLVHVGPDDGGDGVLDALVDEAGLSPERVRRLGRLGDDDLAVVMSRASVFVCPSLQEGFGLSLLEAMATGVPTVLSDAPALVELSAGSGIVVEREDAEGYPERLGAAIARILDDDALAQRLSTQGVDRAKAFSWRDSAEKVWQLHADL